MEEYQMTTELEEMRAQLGLLKQKLDKEKLVNDRMLRNTMKERMGFLNKNLYRTLSASVFIAIVMPMFKLESGISWYLVGYSYVMMAVSILFTLWYHRGLKPDIMNGNMVEVAQRMHKLKRDYQRWPLIGCPMACTWLVWLLCELSVFDDVDPVYANGVKVGVITGFLVGIIVGVMINRKNMKTINQLIEDAESLNKE